MAEIILANGDWEKRMRLIWKRKKIMNLDMQGMMKNIHEVLEEIGMTPDEFMKGYAFRGLVKNRPRTYAEMCVLTDEGYEEYEKEKQEDEYAFPLRDVPDEFYSGFELATRENEFINNIKKLLKINNEVFISVGGEDRKTLEKDSNFEYYTLFITNNGVKQ